MRDRYALVREPIDPWTARALAGRAQRSPLASWLMLLCAAAGCDGSPVEPVDAGPSVDAGTRLDASSLDAGPRPDGALVDSGSSPDGGPPPAADPCAEWDGVFRDDARRVSPDEAASLQTLLDAHDHLRLEEGDYRTEGPAQVRIGAGQSIVARGYARFPDLLVAAGTTEARVRGVSNLAVEFEPGAAITENCFRTLRDSRIVVRGATVAANHFVHLARTSLDIDTSDGGEFRDNRFIKLNSHAATQPISLIGDSERRSGGNSFLLTDSQTPQGSAFYIEGQSDVSFLGINVEAYNWNDRDPEPYVFRVRDTGSVQIGEVIGISRRSSAPAPAYDLDAERVFVHRGRTGTEAPQIRLGESVQDFVSWGNRFTEVDDRATGGTRLRIQELVANDVAVTLDGAELTSPPDASTADHLQHVLRMPSGRPWSRPIPAPIPDATGPNWRDGLAGATDERAALQATLDSEGALQLEPRTYYLGGPLIVRRNDRIIGAGEGRTALVALDPEMDLIRPEWGDPDGCGSTTGGFTVTELTLQGGAVGIHAAYPGTQVNLVLLSHVVFRDMSDAGILVDGAYGWDNNFMDHLSFVRCGDGVRQEGQPRPDSSCYPISEWSTMAYMDKTVFYRARFEQCGRAMVFLPTRANNLNGVVESFFVDGGPAMILNGGNTGMIVAQSVFARNDADPLIQGGLTVAGCSFEANHGSMLGLTSSVSVEGSEFLAGGVADSTVFGGSGPSDIRNAKPLDVAHCRLEMPLGAVTETPSVAGFFLNNVVPSEEPFSALAVSLAYRTFGTVGAADDTRDIYTILEGEAEPGSRFLYSHE